MTCITIFAPNTENSLELNWLDASGNILNNTNLSIYYDLSSGLEEYTLQLEFGGIFLSDAGLYTCQAIANYVGGPQVMTVSKNITVESE